MTVGERGEPGGDSLRARLLGGSQPTRETIERELARTRAEGRLDRVRELHREAGQLVRTEQFAAAVETHRRASADLELAASLIKEWGFDLQARLETERERLADQRALLESRPLEWTEAALARAHEAETRNDAVRAWEHALARYREVLTLGWGTDVDVGDTDALRLQVEWLVGRVVECRRETRLGGVTTRPFPGGDLPRTWEIRPRRCTPPRGTSRSASSRNGHRTPSRTSSASPPASRRGNTPRPARR